MVKKEKKYLLKSLNSITEKIIKIPIKADKTTPIRAIQVKYFLKLKHFLFIIIPLLYFFILYIFCIFSKIFFTHLSKLRIIKNVIFYKQNKRHNEVTLITLFIAFFPYITLFSLVFVDVVIKQPI